MCGRARTTEVGRKTESAAHFDGMTLSGHQRSEYQFPPWGRGDGLKLQSPLLRTHDTQKIINHVFCWLQRKVGAMCTVKISRPKHLVWRRRCGNCFCGAQYNSQIEMLESCTWLKNVTRVTAYLHCSTNVPKQDLSARKDFKPGKTMLALQTQPPDRQVD